MKNTLIATTIVVAGVVGIWLFQKKSSSGSGKLDTFARCLTDKQITMYGADWCSHCQNEKKAFDSSWKLIKYVECPKNPGDCLDAKVESYPTWDFPDGKRLVGEQGLEKLSKESGCPLPE